MSSKPTLQNARGHLKTYLGFAVQGLSSGIGEKPALLAKLPDVPLSLPPRWSCLWGYIGISSFDPSGASLGFMIY